MPGRSREQPQHHSQGWTKQEWQLWSWAFPDKWQILVWYWKAWQGLQCQLWRFGERWPSTEHGLCEDSVQTTQVLCMAWMGEKVQRKAITKCRSLFPHKEFYFSSSSSRKLIFISSTLFPHFFKLSTSDTPYLFIFIL